MSAEYSRPSSSEEARQKKSDGAAMLEHFLQHDGHRHDIQDRLLSGQRAPAPESRRSEFGEKLAEFHQKSALDTTSFSTGLESALRDAYRKMERELDGILLEITGCEYGQ